MKYTGKALSKLAVIGFLVLLLTGAVWYFTHQHNLQNKAEMRQAEELFANADQEKKTNAAPAKDAASEIFVIDIKGAVKKPGIYQVSASERVIDGIERAGGFTKKADRDKINLAQKVTDEMVIHVPEKGAQALAPSAQESENGALESQSAQSKVNINTADEQEMQQLPGVGPAKAKAIIQYRTEHGSFKSVDDLAGVSGIGEKSLERMKPFMALY
ncbi:helix-hairpin-helix domain-containing protein [Sporolactobacillus terrae]|uniref:Competence protein ComEA n=1 Tax=Sporolactobacillus terrae TaxID=269673 RepID=A0A410D9V5_9BACL|nr:helix-hairpin-helix domain-containing protein [Sporolactobacillus terrae]QAA22854.1 competence protein ComEA [Sporolactobacillus terrae]QAA25828.1 competence protein ComEA [Sporolactobacillus terrae]UAK17704.1 helix-hairpin-helix domain-containing protein [Sporolactobacillus terrae]BBN99252.1 competence protein ComEA [Sporolactobacillus terrae]